MRTLFRSASLGLITLAATALTACGGGGGSNAGPGSSFVSGVAATGLAISGGQVSLRCAAGTAPTVTTNADGSYTIDTSGVTLPCIARVTYTDGNGVTQELHSLVKTAGTVNITPITDMVVANLSSNGAAAAYDNFKASEVEGYTEARVQTAMQLVRTKLTSAGVDPAKLPADLIGTRLEAAHGSSLGDQQDQALDELHQQLTQQSRSLDQLETEMHTGTEHQLSTSTGTTGSAASGQTAYAANCASCHGVRIADAVNAANIMEAIRENKGGMGALSATMTSTMANDIATYMAGVMNNTATVKTAQLISFNSPGNQTLDITPAALVATADSGLPVSIRSTTASVCTVSGSTLTLVAAGACSLSASQAGNTSYSAAPPVTVSFNVLSTSGTALTSQTISFTAPGAQTVGTAAALSASASSGLPVSFGSSTPTVCTVSGSTLTPLAAGTCTITADQGGDAIHAAAPTATQSVMVTAAAGTSVASATNGKTLYVSNNCGRCHGNPPASMNVLNGASNPTLIRSAVNSIGSMNSYSGLTDANLADLAAYLATPGI